MTRRDLPDPLELGAVLVLMLIGCGIRIWGLDAYAFSPDDALHIAEARLANPLRLFEALALEDTHPPIHYLLLQVQIGLGLPEATLRVSSVITGVLLVPLLYALGRKVAGHPAGLFAAFVATFSTPLILQAQVLRSYGLELVFLTAGLWLVFDDAANPSRRRTIVYFVLMSLAIFTHYSAVIVVAAVGVVRFAGLLRRSRPRLAIAWAGWHGVLAILTALLVWTLASHLLDSDFRRQAVDDWLAVGFPRGEYLVYWLSRSLAQLVYFVDPPELVPGLLLGSLFAIGCVSLRGRPAFELVPMFLLASASNLLLAALELYPFAATRHALYMIPFVLVVAGAGFAWTWDRAVAREPAAKAIGIGAFVGLVAITSIYVHRQDPRQGVVGIAELPLLRTHYSATLDHIEASTREDEILVGDKQLAYYAWYEGSLTDAERLSEVVGRTRLRGRDFYYYEPARVIKSANDLARFLDELESVVDAPRPARLRFASLGWRSGLLYRLATPGLADLDPRPGDRALRVSLASARTSAYNAGELAGGGVVFSAPWSTLEDGLRLSVTLIGGHGLAQPELRTERRPWAQRRAAEALHASMKGAEPR